MEKQTLRMGVMTGIVSEIHRPERLAMLAP